MYKMLFYKIITNPCYEIAICKNELDYYVEQCVNACQPVPKRDRFRSALLKYYPSSIEFILYNKYVLKIKYK